MEELKNFNEDQRDLFTDAISTTTGGNAIDLVALFTGERDAIQLEFVGSGRSKEVAKESAQSSPIVKLLEETDVPHVGMMHDHGIMPFVDYYASTSEKQVEEWKESPDPQEIGELLGYPDDAIEAFGLGESNETLFSKNLERLAVEGEITKSETKDLIVMLPYHPPRNRLEKHIEIAQKRKEAMLETADEHDLPIIRETIEEELDNAFNPYSDYPIYIQYPLRGLNWIVNKV